MDAYEEVRGFESLSPLKLPNLTLLQAESAKKGRIGLGSKYDTGSRVCV